MVGGGERREYPPVPSSSSVVPSSDYHPMDPFPSDEETANPNPNSKLSRHRKKASLGNSKAWSKVSTEYQSHNEFRQPSLWVAVGGILSYAVILLFAHFRDMLRRLGIERNNKANELHRQRDFVPLYNDFEALYISNVYRPFSDVFNRPIVSTPSSTMVLKERVSRDYCWNFEFTGREQKVLNFGSYNYLGFAESKGPCAEAAKAAIRHYGLASSSTPREMGNRELQSELETVVAEFVGKEAAICFPMGFATNSTNIPSLMGKGTLILSDELNHSSLILGCKLSGATKRVFRHNDMEDLERKLRDVRPFSPLELWRIQKEGD